MMRSTHQPSQVGTTTHLVIRWDRIAAIILWLTLCLAFAAFIAVVLNATYSAIVERQCTTYGDVVACHERDAMLSDEDVIQSMIDDEFDEVDR